MATLGACARHLRRRSELNQHYATELSRTTGLPTLQLLDLAGGVTGPESPEKLLAPVEEVAG